MRTRFRTNLAGGKWLALAKSIGEKLASVGGYRVVGGVLVRANKQAKQVDVLDLPHALQISGSRLWPPLLPSNLPYLYYLRPFKMQGVFPTRVTLSRAPGTANSIPGDFGRDVRPPPESLTAMEAARKEYATREFAVGGTACRFTSSADYYPCSQIGRYAAGKFMYDFLPEVPGGVDQTYQLFTKAPLAPKWFGIEIDLFGHFPHILRVAISDAFIQASTGRRLFPANVSFQSVSRAWRFNLEPNRPHVAVDYVGDRVCFVTSVILATGGLLDYGRPAMLVGWFRLPVDAKTEEMETVSGGAVTAFSPEVTLHVHEFPDAYRYPVSQWAEEYSGYRPSFVLGSVAITAEEQAVYYGRFIGHSTGIHDTVDEAESGPGRFTEACTTFKLDIDSASAAFTPAKSSFVDAPTQNSSPAAQSAFVISAFTQADVSGVTPYVQFREYVYWAGTGHSQDSLGIPVSWGVFANRSTSYNNVSPGVVPSFAGNALPFFPPTESGDLADDNWISVARNGAIVYDDRIRPYRLETNGLPSVAFSATPYVARENIDFAGVTYGVRHGGPKAAVHLSDQGEFGVTFVVMDQSTREWRLAKWDSITGFGFWDADLTVLPAYPLLDPQEYLFKAAPRPAWANITCHRRQKVRVSESGAVEVVGAPAFIVTLTSFNQSVWLISGAVVAKLGPYSGAMAAPCGNGISRTVDAAKLYQG